jgi:hypothetical protein
MSALQSGFMAASRCGGLAGATGALMGLVWNYAMSTLLVWRVK